MVKNKRRIDPTRIRPGKTKYNEKGEKGRILGRGEGFSVGKLSHSIEWLINQKDVMTIQCDVFENKFISKSLFESLGFKEVDEIYLD